MKRWETMTRDELVTMITISNAGGSSLSDLTNFLQSDIKTVPRCHTFETVQDFVKSRTEWSYADSGMTLDEWMMEEIEVEDE